MLLKPRFGSRMCNGIWPPSKPFTATPERLFWPFWPRPAVLPLPEPMPRPTRIRPLRAPALSRMSFSFMILALAFASSRADRIGGLLYYFHHVGKLGDGAAHFRGVFHLDHAVHLAEAQADQRLLLAFRAADRRADLLELDGLFVLLGHRNYSVIAAASASASAAFAPPRPSRSATFLPRRCATDFGEVWLVS